MENHFSRIFLGGPIRGYFEINHDYFRYFPISFQPFQPLLASRLSRPDRILVSQTGMKISSSHTLGEENLYKYRYETSLYWNRLRIVLKAAKQRNFGAQQISTCVADCGPHITQISCRYL